MGADLKQITVITTAVLLSVINVAVEGRDYVPPPSGPYQSSIVINNSAEGGDTQQQVYKFPSPEMLLDDSHTRSEFVNQPDIQIDEPPSQNSAASIDAPMNRQQQYPVMNPQGSQSMPDGYTQWQLPQQSRQPSPSSAWYGYQGAAPNYNQNVWQQVPGYGYPQQNPYSYGAPYQYNGANSPFNGMPSPWNVMPKNPFFSDR